MNYKPCVQRMEMETAKQGKQKCNNNFSARQYIISNYVMSRVRLQELTGIKTE